jgi:hypothetical protein
MFILFFFASRVFLLTAVECRLLKKNRVGFNVLYNLVLSLCCTLKLLKNIGVIMILYDLMCVNRDLRFVLLRLQNGALTKKIVNAIMLVLTCNLFIFLWFTCVVWIRSLTNIRSSSETFLVFSVTNFFIQAVKKR